MHGIQCFVPVPDLCPAYVCATADAAGRHPRGGDEDALQARRPARLGGALLPEPVHHEPAEAARHVSTRRRRRLRDARRQHRSGYTLNDLHALYC